MSKQAKRGFTLTELLVVIAIISILSTIVFSQVGEARAKARDARRIADLKSIGLALQVYKAENGQYPQGYFKSTLPNPVSGNLGTLGWNALETTLKPYLNQLPKDPKNVEVLAFPAPSIPQFRDGDMFYYYFGGLTGYELLARLETSNVAACPKTIWKIHSFSAFSSPNQSDVINLEDTGIDNWCSLMCWLGNGGNQYAASDCLDTEDESWINDFDIYIIADH